MKQLQDLMNDISEWSDATFGDGQRNPAIVYHLKKEVDELIEALHKSNALGADNSVGVGEFKRQLNKSGLLSILVCYACAVSFLFLNL